MSEAHNDVEVVNITMYKALDGTTYESAVDAEAHNAEVRAKTLLDEYMQGENIPAAKRARTQLMNAIVAWEAWRAKRCFNSVQKAQAPTAE